MEDYNPKAMVKDSIPVQSHKQAKGKRRMFCEEASKAKDKIPGANKYQSAIDWNKTPESRNYRFGKDERLKIADEIMKKAKKPEKTTPGPTGYNHYDGWKYTTKSAMGNYKNKEKRTTFVQETILNANQTPGLKYNDVNLVSEFVFHGPFHQLFFFVTLGHIQGEEPTKVYFKER